MITDALGDVVIVISVQERTDDGHTFPATSVFRYDLDDPAKNMADFIEYVKEHKALIEGGQMKNE